MMTALLLLMLAQERAGNWLFETSVDPLEDNVVYAAVLRATESTTDGGKPIMLTLGCSPGLPYLVIIEWGDYIGSGSAQVRYRLDQHKARGETWSTAAGTATVSPAPAIMLLFLQPAHEMIARITTYRGISLTATFELDGVDQVISRLRDTCP